MCKQTIFYRPSVFSISKSQRYLVLWLDPKAEPQREAGTLD